MISLFVTLDGLRHYGIGLAFRWMWRFRRAGEPSTVTPGGVRMSTFFAIGPLRVFGPMYFTDTIKQ